MALVDTVVQAAMVGLVSMVHLLGPVGLVLMVYLLDPVGLVVMAVDSVLGVVALIKAVSRNQGEKRNKRPIISHAQFSF